MKISKYAVILFILLVIFLLACQTEDKADIQPQPAECTDASLIKAFPGDSIDTTIMTKLREFSADVDMDGAEENIELYTAAGRDEQGNMLWDDGQDWLLAIRDGEKSYPLLAEFVQLGAAYFTVETHMDGKAPDIMVMVSANASFRMMRYTFRREKDGFEGERIYRSEGNNWIYSSIPGY